MKKQIAIPTATTNEQNNPFRTQLVQLCKDIAEDKRLQINQEDERFVRIITEERSKIYIIPYLPF